MALLDVLAHHSWHPAVAVVPHLLPSDIPRCLRLHWVSVQAPDLGCLFALEAGGS